MKRKKIIIFTIILVVTPLFSFGQENNPLQENTNPEKNISYTLINEYGLFLGGTYGFTGVFVNGICIKNQDVIGIGVGYESDLRYQQSMPLFVNFRHYFQGKRALKPLLNFAIGTRICFLVEDYNGWYIFGTPMGDIGGKEVKVTPGLYATMAAGFKVKALSFTTGFFMKSHDKHYFGGVEVKVGFTL